MKQRIYVFLAVFSLAMAFALFTDHRWEDWYITFRAAKNLALGNGLVFTVGQHVHSFTSPIGTLLPALLSYLLDNQSDNGVIWLFRLVSASVLGVAALVLCQFADALRLSRIARYILLGMFATNILIVDFSINGMETAFMMLFLAIASYALVAPSVPQARALGLALAGIMYTRPDGFVYVGALMAGPLIFGNGTARKMIVWSYTRAIVLAALLYLPWFLWTWYYYGTPVPHTIVAKGMQHFYLGGLVRHFLAFPLELWSSSVAGSLFLPPYAMIDFREWMPLHWLSVLLFGAAVYSIFIPGVGREVRTFALASFLVGFYLQYVSGQGPMPWYLPNLAIFVITVLALVTDRVRAFLVVKKVSLAGVNSLVGVCLGFSIATLLIGAMAMHNQQRIIEFGNRQAIGLWLHDHAKAGQTVFLECLGYIGYYSNLKTYDFPGMSSPEMVAARKKLRTSDYGVLIEALEPDWLVLRPREVARINASRPGLIGEKYLPARVFDVTNAVEATAFPFGKAYMRYDAKFTVYANAGD